MTTLADLKRRSRLEESLYATKATAKERTRALIALADAGISADDVARIVDEALEREELARYEPGSDERSARISAAADTVIALYTQQYGTPADPDTSALPVEISLSQITLEPEVQIRMRGTDKERVQQYAARMREGDEFPPLVCFYDRDAGTLYLADGFHRYEAARHALLVSFPCTVYEGTRHDAEEYAITANSKHGLPLSNEDKRRAVYRLLRLHPNWSSRKIARLVGCSHPFVERLRKGPASGNRYQQQRTVKRGEQTYTYIPPEPRKQPEHATVWQLENCIGNYLNTRFGFRGAADGNLQERIALLKEIQYDHYLAPDDLILPEHYHKRDLIQAINNVLEQLRQAQAARKEGYTVACGGRTFRDLLLSGDWRGLRARLAALDGFPYPFSHALRRVFLNGSLWERARAVETLAAGILCVDGDEDLPGTDGVPMGSVTGAEGRIGRNDSGGDAFEDERS